MKNTVEAAGVPLIRKGNGLYVARCPFHAGDDTPSFTIYETGTHAHAHCFGCGWHGDAIDFVRAIKGFSFVEALEHLGLAVSNGGDEFLSTHAALRDAVHICANYLARSPAAEYLERRGFPLEAAQRYKLGYAPDDILTLLRKARHSPQALSNCGLIKDNRFAFTGRLVIPIRDYGGRVIALSGRLLQGEGAKYVNSPAQVAASRVWEKASHLYLAYEGRDLAHKTGTLLLVEGYFDALRCQLAGYAAAACMGSSLTLEQARLALRCAPSLVLCLDGDAAGQAGTLKSYAHLLRAAGDELPDVKVVRLEGGDPDAVLARDAEEFARSYAARCDALEYCAAAYAQGATIPEKTASFSRFGKDIGVYIPERFKEALIPALSRIFGIPPKPFPKAKQTPLPTLDAEEAELALVSALIADGFLHSDAQRYFREHRLPVPHRSDFTSPRAGALYAVYLDALEQWDVDIPDYISRLGVAAPEPAAVGGAEVIRRLLMLRNYSRPDMPAQERKALIRAIKELNEWKQS